MKYLVKVLTPEFKAQMEEFLRKEVEQALKEENIDQERKKWLYEFKLSEFRSYLNSFWNGMFKDMAKIVNYYKDNGMSEPKFTEMELEAAEVGFQSRPRVIWNGEPTKIDEIDEIFSFKRI